MGLRLRATDELDLELVRKGSDLNTPGKPAGVSQVYKVPFLPYQADTGFGGAKNKYTFRSSSTAGLAGGSSDSAVHGREQDT